MNPQGWPCIGVLLASSRSGIPAQITLKTHFAAKITGIVAENGIWADMWFNAWPTFWVRIVQRHTEAQSGVFATQTTFPPPGPDHFKIL